MPKHRTAAVSLEDGSFEFIDLLEVTWLDVRDPKRGGGRRN